MTRKRIKHPIDRIREPEPREPGEFERSIEGLPGWAKELLKSARERRSV